MVASAAASVEKLESEVLVHIVDDDPILLGAVERLLTTAGIAAVSHLEPRRFLEELPENECSCVLLDLCMPGVHGLSILRELRTRHARKPVVMMSGKADLDTVLAAMRGGASDFIEKPITPGNLIARMRAASRAAVREFAQRRKARDILALIAGLTPREREVMAFLRDARTVKQIAYELGVSHKTIQVHRARILDGMRVESLVELVNVLHTLDLCGARDWTKPGALDGIRAG